MIFKTFVLASLLAGSSAIGGNCLPEQGFQLGLAGAERPEGCIQRAYRIDFELGRSIRRLRREQTELEQKLTVQTEEPERHQITRRLQTLERELHQLEGLAAIRGLLPRRP